MIFSLPLLAYGLFAGMAFEALPHHPDRHYAFVAALHRDEPAAILILGDESLHVYPNGDSRQVWQVSLDAEVSAFDLYDLNDDHTLEALWIQGATLYSRAMKPEAEPVVLFEIERPALPEGPFPQVLAHDTDDGIRLIAPGERALLEYGLDGTLHRRHPLDTQAAGHAMLGAPFRAWTPLEPLTGAADGLEIHATRVQALKPALEGFATALDPAVAARRRPTSQQLMETARQDSAFWPWFPLEQAEGEESRYGESRVYYAINGDRGAGDTLVRIWRRDSAAATFGGDAPIVMGPERRYPGMVVPPAEQVADFNGDGFSDLLTWRAPQPAPTADSLARAITRGTWTATLSAYLYAPEKKRYQPRAAARIEVELPINWFLSGLPPFYLLRTDDLTGDGNSELLFALDENRLGMWRFTDDGFEALHGAGVRVEEALQRHLATTPPQAGHGAVILFAGETQYWALRIPAASR